MSEEEKTSGISVEDLTEKESLIEELVEREDTIYTKAESASKQQLKDKRLQKISGKAAADHEIRQQELRAKNQEQESQQQMMKAMIPQQQQMNTSFLTVVKELLGK